ncbi:MAG: hypothetical protein JWL82_587, partial [Parcubacteria group bacterium]|nr:hypothetical protein [Parcubacteria group bacterium]
FPVIAIKGWHYADDDELRKAIVGGSLIAVIALMYRWDEYHVAECAAIVYLAIGLSLALFDYRVERRSKH